MKVYVVLQFKLDLEATIRVSQQPVATIARVYIKPFVITSEERPIQIRRNVSFLPDSELETG
jgi:hypothetical protein